MTEPAYRLTLTDAVIRNATLPPGRAQHYLHDVRLQRMNPLDPIKAELLGRLREHYAAEAP